MLVIAFACAASPLGKAGMVWGASGAFVLGVPPVLWIILVTADSLLSRTPATADRFGEVPAVVALQVGRRTTQEAPENVIVRDIPTTPLLMQYRDMTDQVIERVIHPRSLHRTLYMNGMIGHPRITAYCTSTHAVRTFAIGRIVSIPNAETGEPINLMDEYFGVYRL